MLLGSSLSGVARADEASLGAAEGVLGVTDLFGDDFAFTDTTELLYGLPERKYNSFIHASEEAAISRLYGGIHYMMAIEEGVAQGQEVGEFIVNKIQTLKKVKKESLVSN